MSNIIIAEESTEEVLSEAYQLAESHYYEVEEKSSEIPFGLDLVLMKQLLDMGLLFIITVRKDEELVGYFANIVSPDLMTSQVVSKELGIYLHPKYRGGTTFIRMLKLVESESKERGAYAQMLAFKVGHDTGMAERLGYEKTETIYQKLLGE